MRHSGTTWGGWIRLLGGCGLLFALVGLSQAQTSRTEDALPLRRVVLSPEQLLGELKRVTEGTLIRLPRAQFEKKWQTATQQMRMQATPPQLLEARYRATLVDDQSLVGSASWKLLNPHPGATLFPLGNTNLAIRSCRYENRPAPIADLFGNGTLCLLVDEAGEQSLSMDWSARGDPRPEGLQLELQWPESPVAILELNLPVGRIPITPDGLLVAGPRPAEAADRRIWTIACGGRTSLPLLVRDTTRKRPASLFVQQRTVQRLAPSGVESTHTFTFESLHQSLETLTLRLDPRLRPLELVSPDLERWERLPDGRVQVRWSRPVTQPTLEVRSLAALPLPESGSRWESPTIQVEGATSRGETLELRLSSGLEVTGWRVGDFRLLDTTETDQGSFRVLRLQGGGVAASKTELGRPQLELRASGARFRTNTQHLWRLDPEGTELTAEVRYTLERGEVYQLPLGLPTGWTVESVETTPPDLQRGWSIRSTKPLRTLNIDLRRTVVAPESPLVVVRLRPSGAQLPFNTPLAFPEVVPLDARYREAGLAIDYDRPTFRSTLRHDTGERGELPSDGPWSRLVPEHYLLFRSEPMVGTLRLEPQTPLTRSRLAVQVRMQQRQPILDARLSLVAESGRPSSVELRLPEGGDGNWEWRFESGDSRLVRTERQIEREIRQTLAALASRTPLDLALHRTLTPPGTLVRLTFDRPLTPRRPVVLRAERKSEREGARWAIALPVAVGATRFEGEVDLLPGGPDLAETFGLTEITRDARRRFRYTSAGGRLLFQPRAALSRANDAVLDSGVLTSQLQPDGTLLHTLRFRLQRWSQRSLPFQLPADARLLSAKLDDHWVDLPREAPLELPVPFSGSANYVLRYQTEARRGWLNRLEAPLPTLPVPLVQLRRIWFLPQGMRPLGDEARPLPGSLPAGLPLRYPLDVLRVGPLRGLGSLAPESDPETQSTRRLRLLRDARTAWLTRPSETLAQRLRWLQLELLQDAQPLVLDTEALRGVGLTGATTLEPTTDPLGEAGQLEMVAVPAGILLTRSGRYVDPTAFQQALATGQDETAGYQSLLWWLEVQGEPITAPLGTVAWIPTLGTESSLYTVERLHMTALGLLLALTLLGVMVWLRRFRLATRVRWLVGWLAIAGVSLAWLPSGMLDLARWSLLAGILAGLPLALLTPPPPRRRAPSTLVPQHLPGLSSVGTVLLVVSVGILATLRPAVAQPMENLVYLLDATGGDVLVPPSLLKRLESLAKSDGLPRQQGVLTQATYTGKHAGTSAEFTAQLEAMTFTEEAVPLVLPLDNVQLLGDVLLDGAKVHPRTLLAPRVGYEITLRGKGLHKIQLRFRVPITALSEEEVGLRQIRWNAPRLALSHLTFEGPPTARYLSTTARQGSQTVVVKEGTPRLEADLGPIGTAVTVRWLEEPQPPRAAKLQCREAYWWDLRPEGGQLNASLRYTMQGSTATRLSLDLPPELEVLSAQARRPRRSTEFPVRLRDWYLTTERGRQLQLDFGVPFTGEVEVDLVLLPRNPLAEAARLPLPQPRDVEATASLGYLGYRVSGLEAERTGTQGLTGLNPSRFTEDWSALNRPTVERLNAAFTFRRAMGAAPELRLRLSPRPDPFSVSQNLRFRIYPRRVEWTCQARLLPLGTPSGPATGTSTSPPTGSAPGVVEWDLGSEKTVLVSEVTGPAVSRWQQSESRLLVWLNSMEGAVPVTISGFLPVREEAKKPRIVNLPAIRALGAQVQTELIWEGQEVQVTPLQLAGLKVRSPEGFTTANGQFTARVAVAPVPAAPARVTTRVRGNGRELQFDTLIEYPDRVPREVGARLRDWTGTAKLEVDNNQVREQRTQQRRQEEEREQTWRMQSVISRSLRYRISGTAPFTQSSLLLPDIDTLDPASERILIVEPSLVLETPPSTSTLPAPTDAPPGTQVFRLGSTRDSASRVQPRRSPLIAQRPLCTEALVRRTSRTQWLHEVTWWVQPEEVVELALRLPAQGTWLDLRLDDEPLSLNVDQPVALLSLTPNGQVRRLRVRYRLEVGQEAIHEPTLTLPRLEGWQPGPTLWTVEVPVGWELQSASPLPLSRARATAQRDLARAAALRNDPAAAPHRAALLASVERALQMQPDEELSTRWTVLREELGPLAPGVLLGNERWEGTPQTWWGTEPPTVRLRSRVGLWPEHALGATLQWAGLWALVWLGSYSSLLRTLAQWIWPEMLVCLALLAWSWLGPTVAILLLLLAGLVFRILLLSRGVSRWLTRAATPTTIKPS